MSQPLVTVYEVKEVAPKEEMVKFKMVQFAPLPPGYQGKPWSAQLLQSLSAAEIRRLISLYGLTQINKAVAMNAAKGIK